MADQTQSPLELLIRPNQTGNIRPNYYNGFKSASVDDATKNDNVVIAWGSGGDSIFTINTPNFGYKVEDDVQETERTYDTVRIKNKDDPEQYVDTKVMTEWQGRNKITNDRTILRFAPPQGDENSEVLNRNNKDFYEKWSTTPDSSGDVITVGND